MGGITSLPIATFLARARALTDAAVFAGEQGAKHPVGSPERAAGYWLFERLKKQADVNYAEGGRRTLEHAKRGSEPTGEQS